tara:strand:+ start:14 stop:667 length:654 start_codon:yes stop_codon:yes gene_type:complete
MSKIRLHGSSSGHTEVAPAAAAGNNTVTLPNSAGTLLLTDGSAASLTQIPAANIVGVCTSGLTKTGGFGKILQVVQTVKTDTFSRNATAFADITGLSASITPNFNNSKILVDARLYLSAGTSGGTSTAKLNLVRGSTDIGQPSGSVAHEATVHTWSSAGYMSTTAINFLDSPATTSATTYKIQLGSDGTAATLYVNRYYGADNYHGISTLTLMEVAV